MIRVEVREKRFGPLQVLGHLRFEIAPGETVAITGPSGVGKSTLLRIVAGIDTEFAGRVETPPRIGMVFQEPTLLPWRSALENLTLVHPGLTRAAAEAMLARVGLASKAHVFPGQLSLGQQRRLSIARAFAVAPELLILDEPFVSLDPDTAGAMLTLTETLIRETRPATLFVTHAEDEAHRLGARILCLRGQPATLAPYSVPSKGVKP